MRFIIDCETKGKKRIINRLSKLKTTYSIVDNGEYWQDRFYSQVLIDSDLTEDQLDHYLWQNNLNYVGVIPTNELTI